MAVQPGEQQPFERRDELGRVREELGDVPLGIGSFARLLVHQDVPRCNSRSKHPAVAAKLVMIGKPSWPSSSIQRVCIVASSWRKPSPKMVVRAAMISSMRPVENPCDAKWPSVILRFVTASSVSPAAFAGNFAIRDRP